MDMSLSIFCCEPNDAKLSGYCEGERLHAVRGDVEIYKARRKVWRYVVRKDGVIVAGLQIVRARSRSVVYIASNIYVRTEYRRQGLATLLLCEARKDFGVLEPSPFLSKSGFALMNARSDLFNWKFKR